ncbi:hypothetical protein J6590_077567 [Homalodisca vitripennis]|nr:hypothetical protein J6590_077567 [Homalodisca vitripennis]
MATDPGKKCRLIARVIHLLVGGTAKSPTVRLPQRLSRYWRSPAETGTKARDVIPATISPIRKWSLRSGPPPPIFARGPSFTPNNYSDSYSDSKSKSGPPETVGRIFRPRFQIKNVGSRGQYRVTRLYRRGRNRIWRSERMSYSEPCREPDTDARMPRVKRTVVLARPSPRHTSIRIQFKQIASSLGPQKRFTGGIIICCIRG